MESIEVRECRKKEVEALLFAPTPCWSLNLLALKFLDALFYSCKFFLQLVSVLFQPFLLLFCRYETSEEHTAFTTRSKSPLAFSWLTHSLSPPFFKVRQTGRVTNRQTWVKFMLERMEKSCGRLVLIMRVVCHLRRYHRCKWTNERWG
jgi:hypothetical protein